MSFLVIDLATNTGCYRGLWLPQHETVFLSNPLPKLQFDLWVWVFTQVEFFLENISNSILLSRVYHGLGYATYNVNIKFSIHCKTMIINDR